MKVLGDKLKMIIACYRCFYLFT